MIAARGRATSGGRLLFSDRGRRRSYAIGVHQGRRRRNPSPRMSFAGLKSAKTFEQVDNLMKRIGTIRDPKVLVSAMTKYRIFGRADRALKVFYESWEYGLEPNLYTFTAAIAACERDRFHQQALDLFEEMEKRALKPSVVTYSALISACEKGGQSEKALELYTQMKKDQIEPDLTAVNAAISACEKGQNWEQALHFFFQEFGHTNDTTRLRPSVTSYNMIMTVLEKCKQWQKVLEMFDQLEERLEPNAISYTVAISACQQGKKWQEALALLKKSQSNGLDNIIIYTAAMSACEESGEWQRALEIFDLLLQENKVQPTVIAYTAAIAACEKGKQWKRALYLLQDMIVRELTPNAITFSTAISACESSGQIELALDLYRLASAKGHFQSIWRSTNRIDLHELVVPVARTAVRAAIHDLRKNVFPKLLRETEQTQSTATTFVLTVITGQGIHSANGDSILKPTISAMFENEHTNWNGLRISCEECKSNAGRLRLLLVFDPAATIEKELETNFSDNAEEKKTTQNSLGVLNQAAKDEEADDECEGVVLPGSL